jgi:leucine rich repeat protein
MIHIIHQTKKCLLALALLSLGACSKSDDGDTPPVNEAKPVQSETLLTALKAKGFSFEGNRLVVDDKVKNTTSLDLSGKNLTDVTGLASFPNLKEVNLSNNKFANVFDFAQLPKSVTSVNLSKNTIYEFEHLAQFNYEENAAEKITLSHPIEHLILPQSAKYNMHSIPALVKVLPNADVQIENGTGKVEKYTTLRNVPDAIFRKILKRQYPTVFEGDKIDISKQMTMESASLAVIISQGARNPSEPYVDERYDVVSIEGVEYIINHPQFAGNIILEMSEEKRYTLPYFRIAKKTELLSLHYVNTGYINSSEAQILSDITILYDNTIKSLDLSASKQMCQILRSRQSPFWSADRLELIGLPKLESLQLPNFSQSKNPLTFFIFHLESLPKLKATLDLSEMTAGNVLAFGKVPGVKVIFPKKILYGFDILGEAVKEGHSLWKELKRDFFGDPDKWDASAGAFILSVTPDFYKRHPDIKDFVNNRKRVERILSFSVFQDDTLDFVEIKRGVLQEPTNNN